MRARYASVWRSCRRTQQRLVELASGLAQQRAREQAAAHADAAVDAPHRELDAGLLQRLVPRQHVLIDAVDQRAVEIEDQGRCRHVSLSRQRAGPDRRPCCRASGPVGRKPTDLLPRGIAPHRSRCGNHAKWRSHLRRFDLLGTLTANQRPGSRRECAAVDLRDAVPAAERQHPVDVAPIDLQHLGDARLRPRPPGPRGAGGRSGRR